MARFSLLLIIVFQLSSCKPFPVQSSFKPLQRYEFSHPQMGTLFRIVMYAPGDSIAKQAAQASFRRVDELNDILSDYLENSELNKLSATAGTGQDISVNKDLWMVLEKSMEIAKQSNGAFDITIGPYVNLWRRARRQQTFPAPDALAKARQQTGYQYVKLDSNKFTAQLLVPGMKLDAGGIGKGYAADEMLKVLKNYGIAVSLVDAGGNMVAGDDPPGKNGWEIEVASITGDTTHLTNQKIFLSQAAIATSGDMYQYVEIDGKRYSHIVDPRTGIGLTTQMAVTIIAPDGITADFLSTTVSVLGPEEGLQLLKKYKNTAAFILQNTGVAIQKWESERWQELTNSQ